MAVNWMSVSLKSERYTKQSHYIGVAKGDILMN